MSLSVLGLFWGVRTADDLANFFQDVVRRGHLPATAMQDLGIAVQELSGVPNEAEVIWKSVQKFMDLGVSRRFLPPAPPEESDYEALLAHLRSRHS